MEVRNRFKGPNLIDKVPDELWMEMCDIVQETGIKTIPQKNIISKLLRRKLMIYAHRERKGKR